MKEEIVIKLLKLLLNENIEYKDLYISDNYKENRTLLRALINMRPPKKVNEEILNLEDKLLKLEQEESGIVDINNLTEIEPDIILWLGDITLLNADIIVNLGNNDGLGCFYPNHNCLDNLIHTKAGIRLRLKCYMKLKGNQLNNGEILVCDGYNLPCKKVITIVGPNIFDKVKTQDEIDLANCYKNSLEYAINNNYKSIAFPSISTGVFSYPIEKAKYIAYKTIKDTLNKYKSKIKVILDLYRKKEYEEYERLFKN